MDFCELIKTRRTIRRFKPELIDRKILIELLAVARQAPSAANRQPIQYLIVDDPDIAEKIFPHLAWAGYVQPKRTPTQGQKPTAYIIILTDEKTSPEHYCIADGAAAVENILLAAWSKNIGSCWMASIQRENIREILDIPPALEINWVIALGYPDETPESEDTTSDSLKYYLDEDDKLHVPKRKLSDISHLNKFGEPIE